MNILTAFLERRKQIRAFENLRSLDDHMLRDIGFERQQLTHFNAAKLARLQDMGN
jgi:uncharacterized protein YjiS (DUF1127 family)